MAGDPTPVFGTGAVAKSNARSYMAHRVGSLDEVRDTDFAGVWLIFVSETQKYYERDTGDTTSVDDDGETTIVGPNGERWIVVEFGAGSPGEKVGRFTTVALVNLDLSTVEAGDVVNGVTLIAGDDFIATAQTDPIENGPYAVPASGAVVRHASYPNFNDIAGALFSVMRGTADGNKIWNCTSDPGGEIDTDPLVFVPHDVYTPTGALAATRLGAAIDELESEKVAKTQIDTDSTMAADSDTRLPSQKAVKARLDDILAIITGAQIFKGAWDASSGSFPGTTGRKAGWYYVVNVAGTVDGVSFSVGDNLYARVDTASTSTYANNWVKVEGSLTSAEIIAALGANAIALAKIAQGTALSVLGVTGNATANYADIAAGTDGYVLRRAGTALAFGTIATAGIGDSQVTLAKIANITAARILGSIAGGAPAELTITQVFDLVAGTAAQGDIIYRGASAPARLAAGTSGHVLKTKGAGQNPAFEGSEETIIIACSDETTALSAGTNKVKFRMPYAMTLTAVRASLTTAQAGNGGGGIFTVDINEGGTTILSTKLTIDNTELTSTTAATAAVISDTSLADDAEMSIDIDQIGDASAKGLKVYLIGRRT